MYAFIVVVLLAFVLVAPAQAQVHVDIGIHLPAPPQLVVVPEVRAVRYAVSAPVNLFVYGGQYWSFTNGGWYVSNGYNGPWIVVAPQFVPRPVLRVPVRYYRVPPGHWKKWHRGEPPRWGNEWGREWAAQRKWKGHGPERGDGRGEGQGREGERGEGPGHGSERGEGPGRGHGRGR
jgi:hypothetical protein